MIKQSILLTAVFVGVSLSTLTSAAEPVVAGKTVTAAADVQGRGVVKKVNTAAGTANIAHEAIIALQWPPMTMDFKFADRKLLAKLKTGQNVVFGLSKDPVSGYVITRIEPAK